MQFEPVMLLLFVKKTDSMNLRVVISVHRTSQERDNRSDASKCGCIYADSSCS